MCPPVGTLHRNPDCAEGCQFRETLKSKPCPLLFLRPTVKGPLRSVTDDWSLLLSVMINAKNVRPSSSFTWLWYPWLWCNFGDSKGIVLWDDMVGSCVFSSRLREQILHLLIQLEYKWPFLLLMYKPEQIPGCSSTVLEQFLNVATCVHPRGLACCLDRNRPFNTLEVEPPR